MNQSIRVLALSWFLILTGGRLQAQVPTGTPPFGSFGGGPDVINLANLNSHVTIPVIHKPGRGTDFTYDLSYDSSVWYPVTSGGTTTWQPVANWGWRGQTEAATGYVSYYTILWPCIGGQHYTTYLGWTYHDPLGALHQILGSTTQAGGPQCGISNFNLTGTATDGSGYVISITNLTNAIVYSNSGTKIIAPILSTTGSANFTDRNGNEITADSSGHFYDTMSSTTPVLTVTGSGTSTSPIKLTYTAPSGGSVYYQVNYTNYTVATNFGNPAIHEYRSSAAVPLITSIVLPDGSQYTITYEATPGTCTPISGTTCVTARIASVTYPTGGTISYLYYNSNSNFTGCTTGNNGVFSDGSASCLKRTTPDGVWTYTRSQGTGNASTTTITAPQLTYDSAANQTVIQFQGIYETERQTYQGSAGSGTLLQTVNTCYNGAASPCTATAITLPITQRTVTDQYGTSGMQSKHNYVYNSVGVLTEQDDYDYNAGPPTSLLRQILVTYASLGNITAFRHAVTVKNGSGATVAQTNYNYDEVSPTATSGVAQHVTVSGSRGNLTSVNFPVSGLTSHYTYYDTGSIKTVQDVNTATTTYTYSSNTASCQMAFPTGITEAITSLTQSFAYNCTGAVRTQATDENSQTIYATYSDSHFWRPASTKDQTNIVTNLAYNGQTSVESTLSFNSGSSSIDGLSTLDVLGRPRIKQKRQSPGGSTFDSIETDYDAVGRPSRTTLPYSGTAGQTTSPSAPGVTTQFDALGRPTAVVDAGGATTSYTYQNNDVLVKVSPAPSGENSKQRLLEFDSLGRLTSVCEVTNGTSSWPGGTCAQNYSPQSTGYWSKYTYDALGDLLTVTQNAQSSTNQQPRTYYFDAMGRLTLENNPETAQNGTYYTYDTDATCGTSKGDLVKKTDPIGNVVCFSYDALHRPTAVTYPSGSYAAVTPAKHFVYDSATVNSVTMSNTKARLAEAYTCAGSCSSKITDEGFSYTVRGETSDVYQSTPHSGGFYHVNQTYWAHGGPNQLSQLPGLPTIIYGGTIGGTTGLDGEGRVTQVTASSGQNPITDVTYNYASFPTQVTYGSGDSDIFAYDPNTLRMTQFKFNVGTASQSLTGNLTWNANATLGQLAITDQFNSANTQTCNYSHDDLVRISTANCGSAANQSFSYDPFGNITKSGSPYAFLANYSSATNRITSVGSFNPTYDANGNVLSDSLHSYTWDADGNSITTDTVGLTYDALDRMVEQTRSTTYTEIVYSPGGVKLALMNGQALVRGFVQLPGKSTAIYASGGLDHYRHSDWLGSSRLSSTPARTASSVAYAPFGETYAQSGTPDPSFTGMNQDTVSDNYDFLYREYSDQGRWPSPDPGGLAVADPSSPQSWNRYAYVLNNPLNSTDPSGLFTCPAGYSDLCNQVARNWSGFGLNSWGVLSDAWDEFAILDFAFTPTNTQKVRNPACSAIGDCPLGSPDFITYVTYGNISALYLLQGINAPNKDVPVGRDIWHCDAGNGNTCQNIWKQADCVVSKPLEQASGLSTVGIATSSLRSGINQAEGWSELLGSTYKGFTSRLFSAGAALSTYAATIGLTAYYVVAGCKE